MLEYHRNVGFIIQQLGYRKIYAQWQLLQHYQDEGDDFLLIDYLEQGAVVNSSQYIETEIQDGLDSWNVSGGGKVASSFLPACKHRSYAVIAYYTNGESLVKTRRAFRRHFNIPRNRPVPSDNAIRLWINNLEQRLKNEVRVQKPFEPLKISLLFNRQCSEVHADLPNNMLYALE
ncbi:hypothetical protein J6590_036172 [Homalodisca vitripennis]|nr:hypothetical protein J6590_036172 [Homalodisca vitripennis]